jgi:hypothetical protein
VNYTATWSILLGEGGCLCLGSVNIHMKFMRFHPDILEQNGGLNCYLSSACVFWREHKAMKAYWGSGSIDPYILDLGSTWRWVVSFTPRPLYPQGKIPWYPLNRRLGGPQSRSGHGDEEKNSQPMLGLEPPIIQTAAQRYTTELFRLLFT